MKPVRLDYTIYAGGLHALDLSLRAETAQAGYALGLRVHTAGFLSRLLSFRLEAAALGRLNGEGPAPRRYETANRWRQNDVRRVAMRYADGQPPSVTAEPPPEQDDRSVVPQSRRVATLDPLSAIFRLLLTGEGTCGGEVSVFDGRRLYDIRAEPQGQATLKPGGYGVFQGTARVCRLGIETVTGFWNKFEERARYPESLRVWMGKAVPDAPPVPVRLEMKTRFVAVVGHLTGVRRGGEAHLPPSDLAVVESARLPARE
jgi:hypothetical protein